MTAEERREAKAKRREENRRRWEASPKNINHQLAEARLAEAEIPAELPPDDDLRALSKLRKIQNDPRQPLYRRADAAMSCIMYEVGPGQASGAASELISSQSYLFLKSIAAAEATPEPVRMRALRSLAAAENLRARAADPGEAAARRETIIQLINGARREALRQVWPHVCATDAPWSVSVADDLTLPDAAEPAASRALSLGELLDRAVSLGEDELRRRRQQRRATWLAITAKGREDRWRDLLTP
jgi:hypothetical protein